MSAADDLDLLDDTTTTDAIPIATSLSDTQPTNLFTRMMDSLVMWMLQNPAEFLTSLFLFLIPLFIFGAYSAHRLIRELEHNDIKKQKLQRMHQAKRQIGKKEGKKSSKAD